MICASVYLFVSERTLSDYFRRRCDEAHPADFLSLEFRFVTLPIIIAHRSLIEFLHTFLRPTYFRPLFLTMFRLPTEIADSRANLDLCDYCAAFSADSAHKNGTVKIFFPLVALTFQSYDWKYILLST